MKGLFFIVAIIFSTNIQAQLKVIGVVTDNHQKPLRGASISIKDSYDGATSDSLGRFSFSTSETAVVTLMVSLSGYSSYEEKITLKQDITPIQVSIKVLITELQAVTISAGSFEAADKKKGTVLNALDIVTTASAQGDITGALKTLPGTQQVGETGGLFVRGGSAGETKIYIDGNLVNNFFYSSVPGLASRGRFNPFLFKGTVFSAGGYSALYGQALSSAVILESTDMPDKSSASLGLSVIGASAGLQQLSKNKKFSWGATYNFTHLGLAFAVIPQKQDYFKVPVYHEGDINFRFRTKKGGMVKYYGYWNTGKVGFRAADLDSGILINAFNLANLNTYHNLNGKENLGAGWKIYAGVSFSTNKDDINNRLEDEQGEKQEIHNPEAYAYKNFGLVKKSWYAQARTVLEKKLTGLSAVRGGAEYFITHENNRYTLFDGTVYPVVFNDKLLALFAETDIYLTNKLAAKTGLRAEQYNAFNKWNLAPRVSLAYKLGTLSQASFAYGIFYQNPEEKYLPVKKDIGFAKATHYILQYQRLASLQSFRTEVFYKSYDNLYKTSASATANNTVLNNRGYGYAKGIEFFWRDKKTVPHLDYWVSYSYLDTKRNHLNYPGSITPDFAAKHTASLVVKKFILPIKTGFNASYNFASGRPYYHLVYDAGQGKQIIQDQGKTISYNSLGMSVNYLPNLGKTDKKTFSVFVLSISNLLGQRQVYTYNYGSISGNKSEVGPPSKRFIYIGCFLSFGTDRSEDAINNHL
ncbi:MAG: carboxypeptidase-like regulatory domain-containing protein [Ferruginibacter sp.]